MRLRGGVAGSSVRTALGTVIQQALAFAAMLIIAGLYGAGSEHDAYIAAITIPHFLGALIQASVNKSFIPMFIKARVDGDAHKAWRLAATGSALLAAILLPLAVAGWMAPGTIARWLFPDFPESTLVEATRLLRIALPLSLPIGLCVFLGALRMACGGFLSASASHALPALVGVITLTTMHEAHGLSALLYGVAAGSVVQMTLLAIPLVRNFAGFAPLDRSGIGSAARLLPPLLIAAVLSKSYPILEKRYGAALAEGSVAQMACGWKPAMFIFVLVANSIIGSSFPFLAETAASGDLAALRRRSARILRRLTILMLPVLLITTLLRVEMMTVVFERGAFTRGDVERSALALALYMPTLLVFSINGVIAQVFYALGRVRVFIGVSAIGVTTYATVGPWLTEMHGLAGLVATYGVAASVACLALTTRAWFVLGGLELRVMARAVAQAAVALAATTAVVEGARRGLDETIASIGKIPNVFLLTAIGIVGLVVYAGVLRLVGNHDLLEMFRSLRSGRRSDET